MTEKLLIINGKQITENDVKKMTLSDIANLQFEMTATINKVSLKKKSALSRNPKSDVSSFNRVINKITEAGIWVGAIKKEKRVEASRTYFINQRFVDIARKTMKPKDFEKIYTQAENESN